MRPAWFVSLGALLAAVAVGLGAIGAHALEDRLEPRALETYHTAVHYLMLHAVGLVLVGLLGMHRRSRLLGAAGWVMLAGIFLFSGFLFAWVATGWKPLVYPVPVGGVAFIAAWLLVAAGAWRVGQP
jgi:uncharacterized membrane protein YgdD (TMEM256/DUF423 family)